MLGNNQCGELGSEALIGIHISYRLRFKHNADRRKIGEKTI